MNWLLVADLVAKYGIEFVEKLMLLYVNNDPVTPEKWAELRQLAQKKAGDYLN